MKNRWREHIDLSKVLSLSLALCIAILFYFLMLNFSRLLAVIGGVFGLFAPFIYGAVIAYLLEPVCAFFEKKLFGKMKKRALAQTLSVIVTLVLAFCLLGLMLVTVVPQLVNSVSLLISNSDVYYGKAMSFFEGLESRYPYIEVEYEKLVGSWAELLSTAVTWVQNNISRILDASIRAGSDLVSLALALIFSIYIMLAKAGILEKTGRFVRACVSDARYERLAAFLRRCNEVFRGFISGSLLDTLIVGVINLIVMLILDMPYAALISVIVALTNLIPTFGPIIGAAASVLLLALADPVSVLWFLILTVALQGCDAYLIRPLLMKGSTGLGALGVLLAIIVGGKLFGILGMLLAIPVVAIISELTSAWVSRVLSARSAAKKPEDAPAEPQ